MAALFLTAGFVFIRRRDIPRHRFCMVGAFTVSTIFLICYLVYHALHGSTQFTHEGPVRYVYFFILITHVLLAAAVVPLVLVTMHRAWRERFDAHRRIARWTWPVWMYVSVTGVIVYLMLYQLYPHQLYPQM